MRVSLTQCPEFSKNPVRRDLILDQAVLPFIDRDRLGSNCFKSPDMATRFNLETTSTYLIGADTAIDRFATLLLRKIPAFCRYQVIWTISRTSAKGDPDAVRSTLWSYLNIGRQGLFMNGCYAEIR